MKQELKTFNLKKGKEKNSFIEEALFKMYELQNHADLLRKGWKSKCVFRNERVVMTQNMQKCQISR